MAQKHDIGVQKRALRVRGRKPRRNEVELEIKKAGGRWANWCRVGGHPAHCRCVYLGLRVRSSQSDSIFDRVTIKMRGR